MPIATVLTLPYPPSVNRLWRRVGNRTLLSKAGRLYRSDVSMICLSELGITQPLSGPLRVTIQIFPPDKRRRDLDNTAKSLLDALEHAGVFVNDGDIDALHILRKAPCPPAGHVIVTVISRKAFST